MKKFRAWVTVGGCILTAGCASDGTGWGNFRRLEERTLQIVVHEATNKEEVADLFDGAEAKMDDLAGKIISSNTNDVTTCRELQALLIELKKVTGPAIATAVLEGTGGWQYVREAAYRCLLEGSGSYGVGDIRVLSRAMVLTHKDSVGGWGRGVRGGWLSDAVVRQRLTGVIAGVLQLSAEQMPKSIGPQGFFRASDTKDWLRQVLTTALELPANSKQRNAIAGALEDLKE